MITSPMSRIKLEDNPHVSNSIM